MKKLSSRESLLIDEWGNEEDQKSQPLSSGRENPNGKSKNKKSQFDQKKT
jgi:hypothetical protein